MTDNRPSDETNDEPALIRLWPDAARRLGLSRSTAYRYAQTNALPTRRFGGGRIYVAAADLRKIIDGTTDTEAA